MRAAIYCRISRDRVGAGLGVARQEKECRALCERLGWDVAAVHTDNDLSAYSGKPRPGYRQLLSAIEAGDIDALVAWHGDRLHRSPAELETFIDIIEKHSTQIATVAAGAIDLATPSGRFAARALGAAARFESEHKAERHRAKHRQLAEQGLRSGGGTRPFGYSCSRSDGCTLAGCQHDAGMTTVPAEVALVEEAAGRILAGETLRGVCADWNARGATTVTGRPWTTTVLRRVLTSPHTAGLRELHGTVVARGVWPAIIDDPTHHKLAAILLDPSRRVRELGRARRYLLTGLARCQLCDAKLVARPRADKRRCYVCATGPGFNGCGKIRVLAEPFEEEVAARLVGYVDDATVARRLPDLGRDATETALIETITADQAGLEELARDYFVDRSIDKGSYQAARQPLEERLNLTRRRLAALQIEVTARPWLGRGSELQEAWIDMPLPQQRALIDMYATSVTVGPAVRGRNWFDPDRVRVTWA